MKKTIALVMALTLLTALFLAGCGKQATTTQKSDTAPQAAAPVSSLEGVEEPSLISKEELENGVDVGELI